MLDLQAILERATELGAASIHLQTGEVPVLRVHESLVRLDFPLLADAELAELSRGVLSDRLYQEFESTGSVSFLYRTGDASYKASLSRVVDGHGLVLKSIANIYPTPEELGLPPYLEEYLGMRSGLVLLTGPMGCGKSTTQTALLQKLNQERDLHIMTVEEPIEFVQTDGSCLIQQCEVGQHVATTREGVALAQQVRPDLLFVSELNDRGALEAIVQAADSGMLVVASMHASSVMQALAKLDRFFLPRELASFRRRLSEVLRVIACQVLLHKQYGTGVVPVFELLANTVEVREVLASGDYGRLASVMEKNRGLGMCSLDDALYEMVTRNEVLVDEAQIYAVDKDRFEACRKQPQMK